MSEESPSTPAFDDILARYALYQERSAGLAMTNKRTLIEALAAASVTTVRVPFDGYGDSGQIEDIEVHVGGEIADLPPIEVTLLRADYPAEGIATATLSEREAVETLCYSLLEGQHPGWENNGGAFGEFLFDVAAGTISLDFYYRVEETEHHNHQF